MVKIKGSSLSKLKVVFFLILLCQTDFGLAQQPVLDFSNVNVYEPFVSRQANAIAQDSVGYLWIGTVEGLLRFDGQSVIPYQHDKDDINSLPDNIVNLLFVDREKNLWICTNRGLCRYDPEHDNFSPVITDTNLRGASGIYVNAIAEDKRGQLYIANHNQVYKFDKKQNLFLKVTEIKEGKISAIVFDDQNNIWIGATYNGGLFYFNQKNHHITAYLNKSNDKNSISNNEISDVAIVKGNVWIATYGGGIDLYNPVLKRFKHYVSPNQYENFALSIYLDRMNNLWICTLGSLKLYDPLLDTFYKYFHDDNNPKSLRKNLWRFYQDNQGNYWTVHSIGGISYARSDKNFKHFDNQLTNKWRTSEKNISTIADDSFGNLWIGNYFNGIDVFQWKENRTIRYVHQDNDKKSLGQGTIFAIFRDSKQQMWVGSNMGGLQRFNPLSNNFDTFTNIPSDTTSIANNDVRSITEDSNGDLWCIVHGKGVDRFDPKKKIFHHYNSKNNLLGNDYAFQVFIDSKQNLWVATVYGLSVLKKGKTIFKNYVSDPKDSTTINGNEIHSIYEDRKHNIWISTLEGLNKFDHKTGKFKRFSVGLRSKHIYSIVGDHNDNIWVSTSSGISKLDPASGKFTNFDQNDGLLSKEYYDNSCFVDGNNQIYFGGFDGIDIFNPDKLKKDPKEPNLTFTDFKLFYKSLTSKTDSAILDKNINYTKSIILNYKQNSLGFKFNAIDLTNSGKITYNYQLKGFDKNWVESEGHQEASYTNLKPGKYTFMVRARYEDGEWGKKELAIVIQIVPAWWMTTWFKILLGLIFVLTPFALVFWRVKRLRNQSEKLRKLVAERTKEIEMKNDQLKALNSTKDKLFSIISHDLRSPFNSILGFQEIIVDDYYNLSDSGRLELFNRVQSSSKQIYTLIENLLNWAGTQTNSIQHRPVAFDVKDIIIEKIELYRDIATAKGIGFEHQLSDGLLVFADINLMDATLRNLLNNAIKFTPAGGSILVKASKRNKSVKISVVDSGIGMTDEQIEALFNIEKTKTCNGTNGEKGSGLGLVLCKEFVEKNEGEITVKSQFGKGSTFSFTVPTQS